MYESIFKSFLRSLFKTVGVLFGLIIGLFLIGIVIGLASGQDKKEKIKIESAYKPLIQPNAQGIRKELDKEIPVILVLNIQGIIGSEALNKSTIQQQLIESREGDLKDNRVKAILLHINTPGGSVDDADTIYHALKNYKAHYQVPVYAYVEGLCASGGMYIACAADKIYATDASLVGSVGVITPPFFNASALLEKIGVNSLTLYAGKGKDDLSPFHPWKEGEQANLENIIKQYYEKFVDIVVTNRPRLDKQSLEETYGAHVYLAQQAAEYGFIDDANASLSRVLNELAAKIQVTDENGYQVISLEKKNWLLNLMTEENSMQPISNHFHHHIDLGDGIPNELRGKMLYLYRYGM